MKKFYSEPEFEILVLNTFDAITTSGETQSTLNLGSGVDGDDAFIIFPGI